MTEWGRWLYDKFTRHIQVRLTCYFLLSLLPLVAVSLYASVRSQDILEEQISLRTKAALDSAIGYIDQALRNVEELAELISTDPQTIAAIERAGVQPSTESLLQFAQLLKNMSGFTSVNPLLSQLSMLLSPSRTLLSTNYGGKQFGDSAAYDGVAGRIVQTGGKLSVLNVPEDAARPGGRDEWNGIFDPAYVSMVRSMDRVPQHDKPNLLIVTLRKQTLLELIRPLLPSGKARIYLYAAGGVLVTKTGGSAAIPGWDDGSRDTIVRASPETGERMLMVRSMSAETGWSVVLAQPEAELNLPAAPVRLFTYLIIAISVVLAFWISWVVYRSISSPLERLAFGMRQLRTGNLQIRLADGRQDELGYLIASFNRTVEDQRRLIQDHYEQQLLLSKTELKFLQSQINPHFLYNTLDSIYWSAKEYEAEEISEMVLNLSKFFRLSLNKGQETFTLGETVRHLHYYVRVQQIRFSEQFSVEYDISDDSRDVQLLKLLLQPLVENAILHGFAELEHEGLLRVVGRIADGMLLVAVEDNGCGIAAERLDDIRRRLDRHMRTGPSLSFTAPDAAAEGDDLFGLRNVAARMKLYYGERSTLAIESAEGIGTRVELYVPLDGCSGDSESDDSERINRADEGDASGADDAGTGERE
ncbi:histidine kinase [Paenibacillus hodogayensis]|uniref:Histidine kinase n=1 Tax=Paenibacillus hodogayensis TaxID=279208 RepID=A0ABV5VSY2_9BACL